MSTDTDPGLDAEDERSTEVAIVEEAPDSPGIYQISEETYHGGPGVSRSQLWTLFEKSPHHLRYGDRKESKPQRFGKAVHVAVLEPELFETTYYRGPASKVDSKAWKAADEIAKANGKKCIKPKEFDDALRVRDVAHRNRTIRLLTRGRPAIEQSAYYVDETTGELLKVRPDIFSHDLRIMADLKSCNDASAAGFQHSYTDYGYHLQSFMYPLGWQLASDFAVDGFVFVAIESASPWVVEVYEPEPASLIEAREVYRLTLDNYHKCMQWERNERRANEQRKASSKGWSDQKLERHIAMTCWPKYSDGTVQKVDLAFRGYRLTPRA